MQLRAWPRAFRPADFECLFSSRLNEAAQPDALDPLAGRFWAPLLCLFTGARGSELGRAQVSDIEPYDGAWGLRVHSAFAGVRIGLARNSRLIPVHPELVRCRFIAYVAQRKAAGQLTLFPVRTNGASDMQTAPSVGRWFARYAQDVGLHPELRTLRSLRSTFLLACALSGMGGNTRAELARLMPRRHAPWSERKFEPNPEGLAALRFYWISQVRFDGLELSHLHVQDPMAGVEEAFSPSAFA